MTSTIKPGDTVAYGRKFLKSTQTHHLASYRGTVTRLEGLLAYVDWGYVPQVVRPVIVSNLVKADRLHLELV